MDKIYLNLETAEAMERAGIVAFFGASGIPATASVALRCPSLCVMRCDKNEFNLEYDQEDRTLIIATRKDKTQ